MSMSPPVAVSGVYDARQGIWTEARLMGLLSEDLLEHVQTALYVLSPGSLCVRLGEDCPQGRGSEPRASLGTRTSVPFLIGEDAEPPPMPAMPRGQPRR
jgi:hypothetical protein